MGSELTRRDLLGGTALAPWLARAAARPNILLVLTDDQRFDALGCAGNPIIRTPAMDALAARGVRFANAFVTTSVCSASRATLLTGRYGSANGVPGLGGGLRAGERTFVASLRQAGYRTGFVGKWHLDPPSPDEVGFETSTWFVSNGPHFDRKVTERGKERVAPGFIEQYLADQAITFLESRPQHPQPFFLHLCPQLPHMNHRLDWEPRPETLRLYESAQFRMPANWRDDLATKPPYLKTTRHRAQAESYGYGTEEGVRRHLARYYGAITELDRELGRVFAALDRLGLRENTYVILAGDNGWFMGEHGFSSKVLPYDESIRVPFIATGPGIRHGVCQDLVLNADITPTILELAGAGRLPNLHGRSLRAQLEGRRVRWRNSFLYEAMEPTLSSWPLIAVREERWKYIQTFHINDRNRLIFEELYDLRSDAGELRNLAARPEHAATQRRLEAELTHLRMAIKT